MRRCGSKYHEGEREIDESNFCASQLKKKSGGVCRNCVRLQAADWRAKNPEKKKALYARFYQNHQEEMQQRSRDLQEQNNEYSRTYRERNKEQRRLTGQKWRAKNKDKITFYANARRAMKTQATPKWAEAEWEQILALYTEAARLQEETGEKYHVDHIIPLKSDLVCGLHCLANLRVITQRENNQKYNKLDEELISDL